MLLAITTAISWIIECLLFFSPDTSELPCEWYSKGYTWCCHTMRAGHCCSFLYLAYSWYIFSSTAALEASPFSCSSPAKKITGIEVKEEGEEK